MLAIAVGLIVFAVARKAQPASNQQGSGIEPPDATLATELIVATFNIQTGKNSKGKRDISRSARVLKDAALAGVQEVYAPTWLNRLGVGTAQPEALAIGSAGRTLFSATRLRWWREHRGNAIVTKLPIEHWRTEMLPDRSGKSFRNFTVAKTNWRGHTFFFINTHLHTRAGRDEQLAEVLQEFDRYQRVILVGDFNTDFDNPTLQQALNETDVCDAISEAGLEPHTDRRIDWILCKGFAVISGRSLPIGVSDHPYYEVTLSPLP
ncbi:MAG: hypothetical protein HKN50_01020 [Gammaproteobacteria bacterium]|nr:hypothetical protein [Gammaproteobacteria bacterium]